MPRRRLLATFTEYDAACTLLVGFPDILVQKGLHFSIKLIVHEANGQFALTTGLRRLDGSSRRGCRWCQSASTRSCPEKLRIVRGVSMKAVDIGVSIVPLIRLAFRLNGPLGFVRTTFS